MKNGYQLILFLIFLIFQASCNCDICAVERLDWPYEFTVDKNGNSQTINFTQTIDYKHFSEYDPLPKIYEDSLNYYKTNNYIIKVNRYLTITDISCSFLYRFNKVKDKINVKNNCL
jgi:hypothetical protein